MEPFDMEHIMDEADYNARMQQESEAELHFALLDAIEQAKQIGLPKDLVLLLCYATGVNSDNFYKEEA